MSVQPDDTKFSPTMNKPIRKGIFSITNYAFYNKVNV